MKNHKELKLEDVYKQKNTFQEISLVGDLIFWKDSLKISGVNNNAIFVRPINKTKLLPQNLTGDRYFIKSSFHGYGGRSYKCIKSNDDLYIVWIDQISNSIWIQKFHLNNSQNKTNDFPFLKTNEEPRQLSQSSNGNFDANFEIINEKLLYGILEINDTDYLYSLLINKTKQEVKIHKEFESFAGSLSSNPKGNFLSWIEWKSPFMPWENNNLFFGYLNDRGEIEKIKKLNKSIIKNSVNISFFQPYWLSNNTLGCSEDSSGWWNLIFFEINHLGNIVISKKISNKFFEYGLPQWVSGISLFSGCKENFFCLAKNKEHWVLEYYRNLSFVKRIDLPFSNLSDLHADSTKVILKGSSNIYEEELIELEIDNVCTFQIPKKLTDTSDAISKAETFWFEGFEGKETHSWIYKCKLFNAKKPPLLIKAHSGPTSYFNGELNSEVQFWTSRGWFVAEVNYGGSSSFGRKYRDRLNGNWGIVDSEDCKALARILIEKELVDRSKVVIAGSSAGGFTALNALSGDSLFKAAVCKYPVLDLNEMHFNTHRFEKNYLNSLIGDFNKNKVKYYERSPIKKIGQISKPVLLFHGKQDRVIDYNISLEFYQRLLKNNIYSEIYLYEDEGHGFKNLNNKLNCLGLTESFLKKCFSKN
tara:strand:- start:446 stop:2377 length:1932 start_codon:yes stop_codon:yes gene_type:complete